MRIEREFLQDIIKEATTVSATKAEVFALYSKTLNIEVKDQDVENLDVSESTGYAVRVIKDSRPGFAYSTEPERYKEVVKEAIKTAGLTSEDPFCDIPPPAEIKGVKTFDKNISSLNQERAIQLVMEIERAALGSDKRVKRVRKAGGTFTESEIYIVNTEGINSSFKATSCTAHITVAAEEAGQAQMGWGYQGSRRLSDIDFSEVGKEAAQRAVSLLGAKKAKTCKAQIILDPAVASEFLSVLSSSFSADNVQKGKSLLMNRLDKRVFSDRVNIIDNALLEYHLGSRPFDAEGVASRRNVLVKEGILTGYLHNLYTAKKGNTSSTANATRAGIFSPPSVGVSNLYIEASSEEYTYSLEELIKEVSQGILVTEAMGVHTANPITGEFSFGITGLWIEKGEILYPVKEAALSGNMLELFSRVVGVGKDIRFYGKIGSPHLLIEEGDVSA
ncbi:MAG: TldD/PmbA family protein [Nitrospirae bacterium]|nr:MAG: TldD/PmbA family protein [Nitrospirota bacterium]